MELVTDLSREGFQTLSLLMGERRRTVRQPTRFECFTAHTRLLHRLKLVQQLDEGALTLLPQIILFIAAVAPTLDA
eukprot:7391958-Prymnesium_polylepis.1